jgi:beta-1,4-N-acetylglucosaminyltransferase
MVTVGTTQFDDLVRCVTEDQALQSIASFGYNRLLIQYGKGKAPNLHTENRYGIQIDCYDFKASLEEDMLQADLILSHAGAGTLMECCNLHRRLVAVINSKLMDNHQIELASALHQRGHLLMIQSPKDLFLSETWQAIETFRPVPHPSGDDYAFPRLVDDFCGFSSSSKSKVLEANALRGWFRKEE